MAPSAGSRWLVPGVARAETTFCAMVQGNPTVQERSVSFTFQTQSGWRAVCRRATTSSSHEQGARACGCGCGWGDREVEGSGRSFGRFDGIRESTQARASVCPVVERVESCKLFLERARKRVERAHAVVNRAQEQKAFEA